MSTKIKATKKNCSVFTEESLTEDFIFRAMKNNPKEFLDNEELALLLMFPNERTHFIRIIHAIYSESKPFKLVLSLGMRMPFNGEDNILHGLTTDEKDRLHDEIRFWKSSPGIQSTFKNMIYAAYCLNPNQEYDEKVIAYSFISNKQMRKVLRKHFDIKFNLKKTLDGCFKYELYNTIQKAAVGHDERTANIWYFNNGTFLVRHVQSGFAYTLDKHGIFSTIGKTLQLSQEAENISYEQALGILFDKLNTITAELNTIYNRNIESDNSLNTRVNFFTCVYNRAYHGLSAYSHEDYITKSFWKELIHQVNLGERPLEDLYYYFMRGARNKSVRYIIIKDNLQEFIFFLSKLDLTPELFHDFIEMAFMEFIGLDTLLRIELDCNYEKYFKQDSSLPLLKRLPTEMRHRVKKFLPTYVLRSMARQAGASASHGGTDVILRGIYTA